MNKVTVSDLIELTGTEFYQLLSNYESYPLVDEILLSDAYKDFLKSIVNLCINAYSGTPAYFVLKYIRIELCQLEQNCTNDKKKSAYCTLPEERHAGSRFCLRLVS